MTICRTIPSLVFCALLGAAGISLPGFYSANGQNQENGTRLALVIANANYPKGSRFENLPNAIRDAELLAKTLEKAGFSVAPPLFDLRREKMINALEDFSRNIQSGCDAVIYFAGHGIEFNHDHYLIASNARFIERSRLEEESVKLETVLDAFSPAPDRKPKTSIIFLDCCREYPDESWLKSGPMGKLSAGLQSPTHPEITIAYSATSGCAAIDGSSIGLRNSPYALVLSREILSGSELTQVLKRTRQDVFRMTNGFQRPDQNERLVHDFYFTRSPRAIGEATKKAFSDTSALVSGIATEASGIGGYRVYLLPQSQSGEPDILVFSKEERDRLRSPKWYLSDTNPAIVQEAKPGEFWVSSVNLGTNLPAKPTFGNEVEWRMDERGRPAFVLLRIGLPSTDPDGLVGCSPHLAVGNLRTGRLEAILPIDGRTWVQARVITDHYQELQEVMGPEPDVSREVHLRVKLAGKSRVTDSPYSDSPHVLGVFDYEVLQDNRGNYPHTRIRIAHGVIFNHGRTNSARRKIGAVLDLKLVPLSTCPKLLEWPMVDDFESESELEIFTLKL